MLKLHAKTLSGARGSLITRPLALGRHPRTINVCRSFIPDASLIASLAEAAPGDVDAPIGVIAGAAILVTIAATALVPLALNPGQKAADNIFTETKRQKGAKVDPLAKKSVAKKSVAKTKSRK